MKEILFISDEMLSVDGEIFKKESKEIKPTRNFKVGDWVHWSGLDSTIGRIRCANSSHAHCWNLDTTGLPNEKDSHNSCNEDHLRYIYNEEIELHLTQLAIAKGYISGVVVKDVTDNDKAIISSVDPEYEYRNNIRQDEFVVSSDSINDTFIVSIIYQNGKWAEICPSLKKLPVTKDELREFAEAWAASVYSYDMFISEYE